MICIKTSFELNVSRVHNRRLNTESEGDVFYERDVASLDERVPGYGVAPNMSDQRVLGCRCVRCLCWFSIAFAKRDRVIGRRRCSL
jgi:hypothetical protein